MATQLSSDLGFLLQPQTFYSFSVLCHAVFFLYLFVVWLSRNSREGRLREEVENNNFLHYKLVLITSSVLSSFYLFLSIFNYFWSNLDPLIELDLVVRTICWFFFSCYMQFEFGRSREKRFPVFLRLWFGLFVVISLYSLLLRFLQMQNHAILGMHLWVLDFGSILAGLVLKYAGFFGKREGDSLLHDPFINESLTHTCTGIGTSAASSVENTSLYTNAGFFSILTFSWMGPLLSLGHRKTLDLGDVPLLDEKDSTNCVLSLFKTKLASNTGKNGQITAFALAKALFLTCWWQVLLTAVYSLMFYLSTYVGPYLIKYFVQYLNGTQRSLKQGYFLVLAFIIAKLCESLTTRHWLFRMQQASIRLRAALMGTIYQKGLTLSSCSRQSRTSGEMVNIMSVDGERVGVFCWYVHDLWPIPIQIGLALAILYSNLGLASLSALAATIVIMLVNLPLTRVQGKFQGEMMEAKDVRMKVMSEVLRNMRILKFQGWEMKFLEKVISLRKNEESWIKKFVYANSGLTFLLWGTPTFVAVVTFGTCMLMGVPLESDKVLSALATFRILSEPIYVLPDAISVMIQTKVSVDRIASFLSLEDLPDDVIQRLPKGSSGVAVQVQNGTFSWALKSEVPTLKEINFEAVHGMKVAVCGTVGSGKSSLLSSILGEMPKLAGEVTLCGTTAYVSQSPWIQSGKIQDNILFGTKMDRDRYERILEACSLQKDLEILPHGDQTVIGERGINLSGGQKQRIQIARALYQDADIFLFDDPFSAVDAHTGSHLFKECLLGLLGTKTVIYVTHQVEFLPAADLILVMKEGNIVQAGKYEEILESGTEFMQLVSAHKEALSNISLGNQDDTSSHDVTMNKTKETSELSDENSAGPKGQLVTEEEREKGKVGFQVYWKYLTTAYKGTLALVILLAYILFQVLQIVSNYWMAWAAPVSKDVVPPVSSTELIYVFVALSVGSSLCILIGSLSLVTAGYKTATMLFTKMHTCIFRAPMSFFDSTPSGRILSRASTDQSDVDTSVPYTIGAFAFSSIQLLGVVVVMSQIAWEVFIVFVPVIVLCIRYQKYYIETARELARLFGVCKAPIIQHFAESLTGSSTIRSFNKELNFKGRNEKLMDDFSRPKFYNATAMEWLCFRLDMLTSFAFAFSLALLVVMPAGVINPGVAGLAVTYGLSLNITQTWFIWNLCKTENSIISVERILQYTSIPSEPPLKDLALNHSWPTNGEIMLRDLQVRYARQLPFVLRGLTCTFPGGMKTGIVGRTGSGKSTLIQALFRIVDPTVGQILIDSIDICTIGLHDLRSRLSIIPQDPTMFQGTVRSNLDPLDEYTDAEIWEALDCCQLGDEVRNKERKLETPVIENGENWSVGQRQLVCLARVILKKSKILVLDEATASVDTSTDSLIQKTLRQQFSDSTVITIAHRITSVLDSDMVLLLDNGVAVEHEKPTRLLEDKSSMFSKLVLEYTTR